MQILIRELSPLERPALERHLLSLDGVDRRLRFGGARSDASVCAYVGGVDFDRDAVLGVFDDALLLVGAAHLCRTPRHAELGVSVLDGHRNRGIGAALLARAHKHARNWGLRTLFMHCLTENRAMMHLARRQGMQVVAEAGEAAAWLKLPPADALSHMAAAFEQRVAAFDYALKQGRAWLVPGR